jgi:hypothetical protein
MVLIAKGLLHVEQKLRHSHNKPQRFDCEKELLSDTQQEVSA